MASYLPENTSTLEEFIQAGRSSTISYNSLSYKDIISNGNEISVLNVVNDYIEEIRAASCTVYLTDEQYQKYRFKPKLLCRDIYGNAELYFIIMLLNNSADIKDFDSKKIIMLKVDYLNEIISAIYNAEKTQIDNYNTDHGTR